MGRPKTLLTDSIYNNIVSDLKKIPNSDLIFKLTALKAASFNKQSEVAKMYDISRATLQRWAFLYTKYGIEGLKPKPRGHNPSKLTVAEKEIIKQWIISCKDSSGRQVHWTLMRLKQEILNNFDKNVGKTPLWLSLKSMGLSLKKPRPKHYKSDKEKQEEFKKNSRIDRHNRR